MEQHMVHLHFNFLAITVAVVVNFVFGWLYYGPVLGKVWAKEMGINMDQKPPASVMIRGMLLMILGTFLMVYCLDNNMAVWRPSTWNAPGLTDGPDAMMGFMAGFFTWLGFFVPQLLGGVAWENKSWKLFGINAFYQFLSLQIVAMILAFWR